MSSEVNIYGNTMDGFAVYVDGKRVYPKHFTVSATDNGIAEALLYFTPKDLFLADIPRSADGVRETREEHGTEAHGCSPGCRWRTNADGSYLPGSVQHGPDCGVR
jgi:hypothetical protein